MKSPVARANKKARLVPASTGLGDLIYAALLDGTMAEPILNCPRVVSLVGQGVAASMPEPAAITQADVARIIRAAKQAGATKVEVCVGEVPVIIHLCTDDGKAVEPQEQIRL